MLRDTGHLKCRVGSLRMWKWCGSIFLVLLMCGCGTSQGKPSTVVVQEPSDSHQPVEAIDQPYPPLGLTLATEVPPVALETEILPEETVGILPDASQGAVPQNPRGGDMWIRPSDGMTMVYVPAGQFLMGNNSGIEHEQPVHEVILDAYWLDRTEVTNRQFAKFVQETGYITNAEDKGRSVARVDGQWQEQEGITWKTSSNPDIPIDDMGDHPVLHVSWSDAVAYCTWAGAELPTEAQWEYAARGPNEFMYPWGNDRVPTNSNFCDRSCPDGFDHEDVPYDGFAYTAPVGSYPQGASWVGALDMAGNALEWVFDNYDNDYYVNSPSNNPRGPEQGDLKVLRGGSWSTMGLDQRSVARINYYSDYSGGFIGFRCAIPAGG